MRIPKPKVLSEKRLRDYYGMLWEMTTPYMRSVWGLPEETKEEYIQRSIKNYHIGLNYESNVLKCLKALQGINDWDACPFCGRNQRCEPIRDHDDDCPAKLADELMEVTVYDRHHLPPNIP